MSERALDGPTFASCCTKPEHLPTATCIAYQPVLHTMQLVWVRYGRGRTLAGELHAPGLTSCHRNAKHIHSMARRACACGGIRRNPPPPLLHDVLQNAACWCG
jgi:hypothetical protein